MSGGLLSIVVLLVGADLPAPTEADTQEVRRFIQAAEALYGALDDRRALESLAQAKAVPHRLDESVQISLLEGLILSDEGKHGESEAALRAAFALDPEAKLPLAVSPKLDAWIERVRGETRRQLQRLPPQPSSEAAVAPPAVVQPGEVPRRSAAPWIAVAAGAALLAGAG